MESKTQTNYDNNNNKKSTHITENLQTPNPTTVEVDLPMDGLNSIHISAYSVGHVLNDIASSLFTLYYPLYFTEVMGLPKSWIAEMLLLGQVADSISTPLWGFLGDIFQAKFKRRSPVYLIGFLISFLTQLALFDILELVFIPVDRSWFSQENQQWWFMISWNVFNISFAAMQNSQLSVIPSSSADQKRKDMLTNLRNQVMFMTGVVIMLVTLAVLSVYEFAPGLRLCVKIQYSLGLFCSLYQLLGFDDYQLGQIVENYNNKLKEQEINNNKLKAVQENLINSKDGKNGEDFNCVKKVRFQAWFKVGLFWTYLANQITTRIVQVFLLMCINVQGKNILSDPEFDRYNLTLIPLSYTICACFGSMWIGSLSLKQSKRTICLQLITAALVLQSLFFLNVQIPQQQARMAFTQVIISGFGLVGSMQLGTSTSLISDLIGQWTLSSGFVQAIFSICEKMTVGVLFYIFFAVTDYSSITSIAINICLQPLIALSISLVMQLFVQERKEFDPQDLYI